MKKCAFAKGKKQFFQRITVTAMLLLIEIVVLCSGAACVYAAKG